MLVYFHNLGIWATSVFSAQNGLNGLKLWEIYKLLLSTMANSLKSSLSNLPSLKAPTFPNFGWYDKELLDPFFLVGDKELLDQIPSWLFGNKVLVVSFRLVGFDVVGFRRMVYHSSFVEEEGITKACGCPLLPLKSHIKGPAPVSDQDRTDIVDEAITFFRANVFFRNFDIKSSADKLLIYLTFYINVALKRLEGCRTLAEGTKAIINLGLEKVPVPGEPSFPFPGLFPLPQTQKEAELLRNYLKQIREEASGRLLSVAYRPNGTPNKWWLAFAKRKFMNIILPS